MKKKTYVTIELNYEYDEHGNRQYEIPKAENIKKQLCQGWDVDVDEDGPSIVRCECQQCKSINRQEDEIEYPSSHYAREDYR